MKEPKPRKDGYCANCEKHAAAVGSALCTQCKEERVDGSNQDSPEA